METLFFSLALVSGLLILFRDRWLSDRRRAQSEAESKIKELIETSNLEDLPDIIIAKKEEEAKKEKSPMVNKIASWLDTSDLLKDEEGETFLALLDIWLVRAGMRQRFNPTQALSYALIIWGLGVGVPLLLAFTVGFPTIILVPTIIFSLLYPILKLRGSIRERQDKVRAEIPFFIQQLYMTLSTGMATIDEALLRVGNTAKEDPYDSILAAEFSQAQAEYRLGAKSFDQALRDIGHRTGVNSVEFLCEAMIQGYRTGSEMDEILKDYSTQAQEIWRQDMRAFKNKKEPLVTIGLVSSMFGAFVIWSTPMLVQFTQALGDLS